MQAHPHRITNFNRNRNTASSPKEGRDSRRTVPRRQSRKHRDAGGDLFSTALVIGLTASFVAFIFSMATELVASAVENVMISGFIGMAVGCLALALMKNND